MKIGDMAIHKCALCAGELGGLASETVDQVMAAHHAVCEKRPIEPPDYVRWEFPERDRYADGEVTAVDGSRYTIRVAACSSTPWGLTSDPGPGREHTFHLVDDRTTIRRIPRPVGAGEQGPRTPQVGDRVRIVRTYPDRADKHDGDIGELTCVDGSDRCMPYHLRLRDKSGEFGYWCHEVEHVDQPRGGQHEPAPVAATPAPALVDGLSPTECLYRWWDNRSLVEEGRRPLYMMTPAQIATGKAQALREANWSAALRAKVAASREAERNRVRVDLEVDPWD